MTRLDRSSLPAPGPDPAFRFPGVRKGRLPNALEVWTAEHPGLPVRSFLVVVPSGSAADPADRPGLSATTGDMLDEGSGHRSALDIQDALARIGAELHTEVGADATVVALTTLTRFTDRALALLADVLVRPSISEADFVRVRDLRLSRLAQLRDMPPAVADRLFLHAVYGEHPYGHLSIGTEASLRSMSVDEVRSFHRRHYRPAETVIIAVGDGSHDELGGAVEAAFGPWTPPDPGGGDGPGVRTPDEVEERPARPPARLVVADRDGAAQSELRIGRAAVRRRAPDYHALLVLNMVLGGQFVSRVNMKLRQEKGFTYGARTSFDFRQGFGPFTFQASVQTDVTIEAVRETLLEIEAIRSTRPPTEEELQVARAALGKGYSRNFETAEQVARSLAQIALYGLPDDHFETFVPQVNAVTREQATDAAVRHLEVPEMVVAIVGSRSAFTAQLAGLGLEEAVEAADWIR